MQSPAAAPSDGGRWRAVRGTGWKPLLGAFEPVSLIREPEPERVTMPGGHSYLCPGHWQPRCVYYCST
jgi:hypothetical protein